MKEPKQLVIQINQEEKDLNEKLARLENFMMCEDFIKISAEQKRLLEQQHKAMTEYKLILIKRAHRINWEAGRDKAIQDITDRIEKEKEKPTTTNPEILGCEDCKHALYKPEDKGKPSCENPNADGKTCWEPKAPKKSCNNCKHGEKEITDIGQTAYSCDKIQCEKFSCWEAK